MTAEPTDDDLPPMDDELVESAPRKTRERTKAKTPKTTRRRVPSAAVEEDLDEVGPTTERLQKVLASAGLASRRHCEDYILEGRVTVDGQVVKTLGIRVDVEKQRVCVDGERVKLQRRRHFLLNKPSGVHCTNDDPMRRTKVIDLLPPDYGRLFTVGRLDENSEGLILVTNDGELAHRLAHPRFQVERIYRALVAGTPTDEVLRELRQGMYFTEGKFRVRDIRRIKVSGRSTVVEVVLTEGQNREVRRLFARVGHKVMKLKRIGFGPLRLGDMPTGAYRPLTPAEIKILEQFAATSPSLRPTRKGRPVRNATAASRATRPVARGHASRGPSPTAKRRLKPGQRSQQRRR